MVCIICVFHSHSVPLSFPALSPATAITEHALRKWSGICRVVGVGWRVKKALQRLHDTKILRQDWENCEHNMNFKLFFTPMFTPALLCTLLKVCSHIPDAWKLVRRYSRLPWSSPSCFRVAIQHLAERKKKSSFCSGFLWLRKDFVLQVSIMHSLRAWAVWNQSTLKTRELLKALWQIDRVYASSPDSKTFHQRFDNYPFELRANSSFHSQIVTLSIFQKVNWRWVLEVYHTIIFMPL